MSEFWYKMVISGRVKLEDVPEKYRDEVEEMLKV